MTSLSGLQSLSMGGKQVSATAIVKDRISKRLMSDGFRAWSLSSAWGDSSFRSVETCNQSTDGWTVSDESHWELAYLVAFWALEDGFWPHRDGDPKTWTVLGHREMYTIWDVSYGTACPGGMDLNLVTRRAQGILLALNNAAPSRKKVGTMGDRTYYARIHDGNDNGEWMIGGVDLFDDPANDPKESGYYTRPGYWVTTELEVALRWAAQYSFYPPDTLAVRLEVADYIEQQAMLTDLHEQWVKGMRSLLGNG
jgi:hypothetical protein